MALRIASRLPEDLEALVSRAIDCCVAVHRELGPGLFEQMYSRALAIELETRGYSYTAEKTIPVRYRGRQLCQQRIDLFIGDSLILEVKSVERLHPVHIAQILTYLKLTGLRVGLLANFNVPVMKDGLRRVVL